MTPPLVDVHCHINFAMEAIPKVLTRAKEHGVRHIIVAGLSKTTNQEVLTLAKEHELVQASLGLYPTEVLKDEVETHQELEFIKKNIHECVALGEVGLDYMTTEDRTTQQEAFEKIITLAQKHKKTLVVHTRKAESDALEMLHKSRAQQVVLHCFGGSKKLVRLARDYGFYFSIPSIVHRLKHFEMIVSEVPLSHLLTETDAPYLSPDPARPSEPADVRYAVKRIAQVKNISYEDAAGQIYHNFCTLFAPDVLKE